MRTDKPVQRAPRQQAVRLKTGEDLTGTVQPLLHEIRRALINLSELGEASVFDLRNIS
jgi:hypothetical protein